MMWPIFLLLEILFLIIGNILWDSLLLLIVLLHTNPSRFIMIIMFLILELKASMCLFLFQNLVLTKPVYL